nr:unnamed protein product [Callosobruchus chinensis]
MVQEEKEFLKFVCAVLDTNAFELVVRNGDDQTSVRGLYPLGGLANHRCFPNTFHVFDDKQRMVTRASVFIKKDEEIFHSYTKILWGTSSRLLHLKETKHFVCKCERCTDPTEFGTYMNAITCNRCKGNVVPIMPQKNCDWRCEDCMKVVSVKEVGKILTLIGSVMRSFRNRNFTVMYSFLKGKLSQMVPDSNQAVLELKFKIIWFLGYAPGFEWKELPLETLILKKRFCRDIIGILEKLKVGLCKIKGLLLYEIYLCSEEIDRRKVEDVEKDDVDYLKEATDILKFDASAPTLITAGRSDMNGNGCGS